METIKVRDLKVGDSILIGGADAIVTFFQEDAVRVDVFHIKAVTDITFDFAAYGHEDVVMP